MMNDHNFSFSSILFSFTDAGNARDSRGKEGAFHCSLALSPLGNIQTFMCKFVSEMATVHFQSQRFYLPDNYSMRFIIYN